MVEEAVEIIIETGSTTTIMKVTVNQVRDYAMEKHVMEDTEILTALHQTQKIEIVGIPTTLTSTTISMKTKIVTTQVTM